LLVGTNEGVYQWTSAGMKPARTYLETTELTIHSLHADQYGHVWIGTERGLYEYAPDKPRPFIHRHDEEREMSLSDDKVISIEEDKSGVLWFGTFSAGVEIFYREQEQFVHQERSRLGARAFPSDDVHSLLEVGEGVHWIGTSNGIGVMSYLGADPGSPRPDAQLSSQLDIRAMCAFGKGYAVGTHRQGVFLLDSSGTITRHLSKKQEEFRLSDDRISDLLARGDALWIATEGGGLNIYRTGDDEPEVIKYDPLEPERLRDNRITVLAHGLSGRIWLGTASTGVQQYDPARNTFVSYRSANDSLRALSNDKINSILIHDSMVWIGTRGGGLNAIDLRTGHVEIHTVSDGLSNNVVHDIESDDMGRLWISTNKGISVLDISSRTFTNYNDIDGLGNLSFNPNAGLRNSAGEILFGGRHGLDIIKYRDIRLNTVLPKVYFTAVKAFSNKLSDYDPQLSGPIWQVPERLEFSPDIDLVTIEFAGLNYRKPEKNRYAYRLAGLTEEWTQLEDNRQVTFSNLPPGNYSLEVKAANNDGLWSAEPASIVLEFLPAYYQTNWFRALVVLGILGLVYAIYMYRVKDVKRQNRRLENRVKSRTMQIVKERDEKAVLLKEIHHRVKNNLQIVNSMLRLQSYYVKDQEALYALEETQNRVMSMAMIHERMYKTENLANIDLEEYLTDLCRDIISTYDLRNSVKLHADIRLDKLNIDTLTPLGLIINEVASNAMKYAFPDGQEGTFRIVLERHGEDKLRLRVGDDGVGMPLDLSDGETDSLGTTLMDSLSDQLNGELIRLEEKGTMYELVFEEIHK
jgi:two-component sensor histidine kinase